MREVAVVSYAQTPTLRNAGAQNEIELLMPTLKRAMSAVNLDLGNIDFVCSGSADYLQGAAFAFVTGVDSLGAVPPIKESHVEMDAAWALYEAWLKIQMGHADTALVYGFGKSSLGDLPMVLCLQLDPYYLAPLWPDSVSLAALQARSMLDSGAIGERDMAEVVARSRANAKSNPNAQLAGDFSVDALLAEPMHRDPLRRHDCPPISDGASAVVLAAEGRARELVERPAWIRAMDHRIESSHPGVRDLAESRSTAIAAERVGAAAWRPDVAELHAPFSHQELLLSRTLRLDDGRVEINPSGGPLAGHVMMAAGLDRIGEASARIMAQRADRALAHASSGACLQQNMLVLLEGD